MVFKKHLLAQQLMPGENHDFNTGPTMTNYAIEDR